MDRLGAAGDLELAIDVMDMRFDRPQAEHQLGGDFAVGETGHQQPGRPCMGSWRLGYRRTSWWTIRILASSQSSESGHLAEW